MKKQWTSILPKDAPIFETTLHVDEFTPEDARSEGSARGGGVDKKARAIMFKIQEIVSRVPSLPYSEIWKLFPDYDKRNTDTAVVVLSDGRYRVYRDGMRLIQIDPRNKKRGLIERSLEKYIIEARKEKAKPRTK